MKATHEELFEGIIVLERYTGNSLYQKYEAQQQLAKTPVTQGIECKARISQCESAYHIAAVLLQKYRNKYPNRIQSTKKL